MKKEQKKEFEAMQKYQKKVNFSIMMALLGIASTIGFVLIDTQEIKIILFASAIIFISCGAIFGGDLT